jgi:hypothetical protein
MHGALLSVTTLVRAGSSVHRDRQFMDLHWLEGGFSPRVDPAIIESIECDALWLASHHLMDYSLLVVLWNHGETMRLSIIDFLQVYNTKKRLARWIRSIYLDASGLSTAPPDDFAQRFIKFVAGTFVYI